MNHLRTLTYFWYPTTQNTTCLHQRYQNSKFVPVIFAVQIAPEKSPVITVEWWVESYSIREPSCGIRLLYLALGGNGSTEKGKPLFSLHHCRKDLVGLTFSPKSCWGGQPEGEMSNSHKRTIEICSNISVLGENFYRPFYGHLGFWGLFAIADGLFREKQADMTL